MADVDSNCYHITFVTLSDARAVRVPTPEECECIVMPQDEFDEIDELRRLAQETAEPRHEYFATT